MSIEYYICDTETSGLNCGYHEISELSVIRYSDKVQLFKKLKCLYPKRASYDALRITNKTINDLYFGEDREKVVNTVNKLFESDGKKPNGRCVVAYNATFDRRFIHSLWDKVGQKFEADLWLDPLQIMRDYAKQQNMGKVKLDLTSACNMFGIKKFAAHTASGDSRRLYFLLKTIIEDLDIDLLQYIKSFPHKVDVNNLENLIDDDLSILDGIELPF